MAKISLAGFKDPVRRPRYIIWTGVAVFVIAAIMIPVIGMTSTYWFCANVCHKVQDDTIAAYNNSSHSKISCMACHMPVNADPFTFLLHKAEALGELYLTVAGKYEIPLNKGSELALEFKSDPQCTQCHSENREITPGEGIIIDHAIHEENEVGCTFCHNRVAHNEEGITFVNTDPATGELNTGHPDYMTMTACFRCHGLEEGAKAPGTCSACHPADFELKPESHFESDFYPKGHAEMAKAEAERIEALEAEAEGHGAEGEGAEGEGSEEGTKTEGSEEATESSDASEFGLEEAYASGGEVSHWAEEIPEVGEVNYCSTCHKQSFCENCHGMEMPHPQSFIEKEHPDVAKAKYDKCQLCHQPEKTFFCDNCHHGTAVEWTFDPKVAWKTQHATAVSKGGTAGCLDRCHEVKFCYDCHAKEQPVPSSHRAADWLRKPAAAIGAHAEAFKGQPSACEICHGADAPNKNAFCMDCHKLEMPHPQEFKNFHMKTGKEQPATCANCHTYKELCSDCHHEGAKDGTPWLNVHGGVVNTNGAAGCFEKCHQDKAFCVNCHTARTVVPASHKAAGWTRRTALSTPAVHPATYEKTPENCTYCHGDGTPDKNAFCMGCHGLAMPHPSGFGAEGKGNGGEHQKGLTGGTLKRESCATCHTTAFCNQCHHGYTGSQPWVNYHPNTVKKDGATPCFDCHEETYCSYCHVRQASQFIGQ